MVEPTEVIFTGPLKSTSPTTFKDEVGTEVPIPTLASLKTNSLSNVSLFLDIIE